MEYHQRYMQTPDACVGHAKTIIDQIAYHHSTGDQDSVRRDLCELSETMQRARFIDLPVDIANVPQDEHEWTLLTLEGPRRIPKIDLQWLYDTAPERIQNVIELLHVIGGRDKRMAPVLVMFVMNLASNLLGKEVVGLNRGRSYYGNTAFVALLESGSNKFFIDSVQKPLEAILRQLTREQPAATITLNEQQQQRGELRRQHGLSSWRLLYICLSMYNPTNPTNRG